MRIYLLVQLTDECCLEPDQIAVQGLEKTMKTADVLFVVWLVLKMVVDVIGLAFIVWRFGR